MPDVTGVDRLFVYLVPDELAVSAGMVVRVTLAGRKVRAWVVDDHVEIPAGVDARPIERVLSVGLDAARIDLARFAQWRYAGRIRPFLLAGSPERDLDPGDVARQAARFREARAQERALALSLDDDDPVVVATRAIIADGGGILELPPNASRLTVTEAMLSHLAHQPGPTRDLLVLLPERRDVETLAGALRQRGHPCATLPEEFFAAYAQPATVIGTRNAAFGPVADLGAILVIDIHAQSFTDQRAPTWNAPVVASERGRRAEVPVVMTSPCPPLAYTHSQPPHVLSETYRRGYWPAIEVIDRRQDDPRAGLYAPALGEIIRQSLEHDDRPVACVLHRTGRLRLLACHQCGEIACCTDCGGAMRQQERPQAGDPMMLTCSACGSTRPMVCAHCHSTVLKALRVGATRAAEELSALVGAPTSLVTGEARAKKATADTDAPARIMVGTEAVLHRMRSASLVAFLDFDQHLLAPRFSAAEESLALIALAGRLVGSRRARSGQRFSRRLVIQTRLPDHDVLRAAVAGDPSILRSGEQARRRETNLPPFSAMAIVSGDDARNIVQHFEGLAGLEVVHLEPVANRRRSEPIPRYLVRTSSTQLLCDMLEAVDASGPGVRIEVDPVSI